jgi:hypothetical protein
MTLFSDVEQHTVGPDMVEPIHYLFDCDDVRGWFIQQINNLLLRSQPPTKNDLIKNIAIVDWLVTNIPITMDDLNISLLEGVPHK